MVGVDAAAAAVVVVVANGLVELEGAGRMATWFIDHFAAVFVGGVVFTAGFVVCLTVEFLLEGERKRKKSWIRDCYLRAFVFMLPNEITARAGNKQQNIKKREHL